MEIFSAFFLCAGNSPVAREFPSQRPVTRSFDAFFDLRLSKRLSKQSKCRWFATPSHSLWRHSNGYLNYEFRELVWHPHGHPSLVRPPTDIKLHSEDLPSSTAARSCRHLLHVGQGLTDPLSPLLGCYLWKNNMMTSSNGNIFRVTGHLCWEFNGDPAQRPATRSFNVFFICAWINLWVNNREADDLRRYRSHYDVRVTKKAWRRRDMEKVSELRSFVGNPLATGGFHPQRANTAGFDVFFDGSLTNCWSNSRYAGDLRGHAALVTLL